MFVSIFFFSWFIIFVFIVKGCEENDISGKYWYMYRKGSDLFYIKIVIVVKIKV